MRWIATTLLAVAVLLGSLTGSAPHASAAPRAEAGPENIPTLAYYYQWFQPASWNRAKTDYPLAGRYSSDDVALMRRAVGPDVGVKASGGVRTLADLDAMRAAGANRIGTSSGVQIVETAQTALRGAS